MSGRKTKRCFAKFAVFAATVLLCVFVSNSESRAQSCSPNMLSISGNGSYIATPDADALHLVSGFTIELWAKLNSYVPLAGILEKGNGTNSFYGLLADTGQSIFGRLLSNRSVRVYATHITSLSSWHHYALTFTPFDSLKIYLDGTEEASVAVDSGLRASFDSLRIGASANGASFIGALDDLRIWNTARSESAIRADRFQSLQGDESGLVLYYPFDDEITATRIHDFSNHGHDGLMRGDAIELVASSSPFVTPTPGFRLNAKETRLNIPTKRCSAFFDTVIHIRNLGTESLLIDSIGFLRGQAFSVSPTVPFSLPPDTTFYQDIHIHFAPQTGGTFDDSLYIYSTSDDCAGMLRIGVHASYDSVGVIATPGVLHFGDVTQCELPTQSVTLRNTSTTDSVTIVGENIPVGSGLQIFSALPIKLAPGESKPISIGFGKGQRGNVDAMLGFSLDKCSRQATIDVEGVRQLAEISLPGSVTIPAIANTLAGVTFDTTIILRNTGDVAGTITIVRLAPDSLFHLAPISNVFVNSGDTIQLHIHFHATECGHYTALLSAGFSTCGVDTTSKLSIDITAPQPFIVDPLDAGIACIYKDTTMSITNPNDFAVRIDTISFSTDAVFFTPYGSFPITIAPHETITDSLRFAPGINAEYHVTALIHSSPCGIQAVDLRGEKGINNVGFGQPLLSFGRGCNASDELRTIILSNHSTRSVLITDTALIGSTAFSLRPPALPFVLAAGASKAFTITYHPTLGSLDTGSVMMFGNEGCPVTMLKLRGSRERANVALSVDTLRFDTTCIGSGNFRTVSLKNLGIDSISIVSAELVGSDFSVTRSSRPFASDSSQLLSVEFLPQHSGTLTGTLTITLDSCGTVITLPLIGSGGTSPSLSFDTKDIEFGPVRVRDTATYCVTVTNPSCTPLILTSSLFGTDSPIHLTASSRASMPMSVVRGAPVQLCFEYTPTSIDTALVTYPLVIDSINYGSITLTGSGLAPRIIVTPKSLDFGFVSYGDQQTLPVTIQNVGNDTAHLSETIIGTTEYSFTSVSVLAPGATSTSMVTFAPQNGSGFRSAEFIVRSDMSNDTVQLRAQGTEKGTLLSALALDFGDVHVRSPLTKTIAVTAKIDLPTIESVTIPQSAGAYFTVTTDSALPYTIKSNHDTLWARITYLAPFEEADTSVVTFVDAEGHSIPVPLTGRGVEAHPLLHADTIQFGSVLLGDTVRISRVLISDTGLYQLYVTNIVSGTHFTINPDEPTVPILPGAGRTYTITFAPDRLREVVDTLEFETSSPDPVHPIYLFGSGRDSSQSVPHVGYSVASAAVLSGDHVPIPITLIGTQLSEIDVDTIVMRLGFDPTMVHIDSVSGDREVKVQSRNLNDSTLLIRIPATAPITNPLVILHVEALLGNHPTTYIRVDSASPAIDVVPTAPDGAFTVTDCGGELHGVLFAGDYALHASIPNPVSDRTMLDYNLGVSGPVTIRLFNVTGVLAKEYSFDMQTAGPHTMVLDVSKLPNGKYVYRLTSLDFTGEGTLIVLH